MMSVMQPSDAELALAAWPFRGHSVPRQRAASLWKHMESLSLESGMTRWNGILLPKRHSRRALKSFRFLWPLGPAWGPWSACWKLNPLSFSWPSPSQYTPFLSLPHHHLWIPWWQALAPSWKKGTLPSQKFYRIKSNPGGKCKGAAGPHKGKPLSHPTDWISPVPSRMGMRVTLVTLCKGISVDPWLRPDKRSSVCGLKEQKGKKSCSFSSIQAALVNHRMQIPHIQPDLYAQAPIICTHYIYLKHTLTFNS